MPSAKQIAWRKKFARMSKAGKFKKSSKKKLDDYKSHGYDIKKTPITKGTGSVIIHHLDKKEIAKFKKLGYDITEY